MAGLPQVARRLPDRPALPAIITGLLALLFAATLLVRSDGDPSRLVHAAPPWTDPHAAPGSLTVQTADRGFDGQFFYRLAVSPLSKNRSVAGVRFDLPALRNARWLYGAMGWASSGGDRDLVPWSLLTINVAAATAVGALCGALARDGGRHAVWGLLLALYPGFAYSLSLDTSELVAAMFLLAALLALRRGRWAFAAGAFTLAVLTRDTTVVVPAGVALAGAWTWARAQVGRPARPRVADGGPLVAGLVPLAAFGAWQLLQRARFGALPITSSGDNNLSAPLRGLVHELRRSLPPASGTAAFRLASIAVLLSVVAAAALCLRRSAVPLGEKVAWVASVLVVVLLNGYLWSGATAFMRAATEAYLLSALVVLGGSVRVSVLSALPVGGLWVVTASAQVAKAR